MKKLMFLAAMMAMALVAVTPAVLAQVIEDEVEQGAESGDAEIETEVSGEGSNSSQCAPLVQGAQTGGNQGGQTFTQYGSAAEDVEIEGGGIDQSPESENECVQEIQQAAAAGKATPPKGEAKAPAPAPKPSTPAPAPKPPAPKPEEKKEVAKKEEKKELPKTGGSGSASLLALGAGALLIGGGLLVRRIVR